MGKRGDFYTSVSVGGLFGQLGAFQFSDWFAATDETRSVETGTPHADFRLVEAGAHNGQLARDILSWFRDHRPETFAQLVYYIIEPSPLRREWQRVTLQEFSKQVKWANAIGDLKKNLATSVAIIFSNELLDAFPVHRFGWDAPGNKWFEWGVGWEGGRFVWSRLANTERVAEFTGRHPGVEELSAVLPDGYTCEISPAAEDWWRAAASVLARGKLVTIDYGFTADEQFSPSRVNGTLRGYRQHRLTDDVLADPGDQDLTAHVNFSAIQRAGENAGLRTESFGSQAQFLTRVVENIFKRPGSFGEWGGKESRQLQTLVHPEHLGRAFHVLVQSR